MELHSRESLGVSPLLAAALGNSLYPGDRGSIIHAAGVPINLAQIQPKNTSRSVGKLVVKGKAWQSKLKQIRAGDKDIYLHVISSESTANLLEDKPHGYAILRLDPVFVDSISRSPLMLTYKFGSLLFTQKLRCNPITVKQSKKGELRCITQTEGYNYAQRVTEWLPKLQRFIEEFVSNKNFVERNLAHGPELQNELYYKKFIIFPASGTRVVLYKKHQDQLIKAEAGVVFSNFSFFGKIGDEIRPIVSFNTFLLEFLDINAERNPEFANQLSAALGYQYKQKINPTIPSPRGLKPYESLTLTSKERQRLVELLQRSLVKPESHDQMTSSGELTPDSSKVKGSTIAALARKSVMADNLYGVIEEVFNGVKVSILPNEKMVWIQENDIFTVLLSYCEHPGFSTRLKRTGNELNLADKRDVLLLKIFRHLVNNNEVGSEVLCEMVLSTMFPAPQQTITLEECYPFLQILYTLIVEADVEMFTNVFVRELGVMKLVTLYGEAMLRMESMLKEDDEFKRFASRYKPTTRSQHSSYSSAGSSREVTPRNHTNGTAGTRTSSPLLESSSSNFDLPRATATPTLISPRLRVTRPANDPIVPLAETTKKKKHKRKISKGVKDKVKRKGSLRGTSKRAAESQGDMITNKKKKKKAKNKSSSKVDDDSVISSKKQKKKGSKKEKKKSNSKRLKNSAKLHLQLKSRSTDSENSEINRIEEPAPVSPHKLPESQLTPRTRFALETQEITPTTTVIATAAATILGATASAPVIGITTTATQTDRSKLKRSSDTGSEPKAADPEPEIATPKPDGETPLSERSCGAVQPADQSKHSEEPAAVVPPLLASLHTLPDTNATTNSTTTVLTLPVINNETALRVLLSPRGGEDTGTEIETGSYSSASDSNDNSYETSGSDTNSESDSDSDYSDSDSGSDMDSDLYSEEDEQEVDTDEEGSPDVDKASRSSVEHQASPAGDGHHAPVNDTVAQIARAPRVLNSPRRLRPTSPVNVPLLSLKPPGVPSLALGTSLSGPNLLTRDSGSRFSRREGQGEITPRSPKLVIPVTCLSPKHSPKHFALRQMSFYITKRQELSNLASNLSETLVAADLTGLLPFKKGFAEDPTDMSIAAMSKRRSERLSASLSIFQQIGGLRPVVSQEIETFRHSMPYRIKVYILAILAKIAENPLLLQHMRDPVNMLFKELVSAQKNDKLANDTTYQSFMFSVLRPLAERVEYTHRSWELHTNSLSLVQTLDFRTKLDKFLWRVATGIQKHLASQRLHEVDAHLSMLAAYVEQCPTRVMSSQVMEVCMKSLLQVKVAIFSQCHEPEKLLQRITLMHKLLRVFDAIAAQSKHEGTITFFISLLMQQPETVRCLKYYCRNLLLNEEMAENILMYYRKEDLLDFRLRIIKHFTMCLELITKKLNMMESNTTDSELNASGNSEPQVTTQRASNGKMTYLMLLTELEFLFYPETGYFALFFSKGEPVADHKVKLEMLRFIKVLLEVPGNLLLQNKIFIEHSISFHYLSFLKMYNSAHFDDCTLTLCVSHLQILLVFAEHSNDRISRKVYQLSVMDFLARQISLEYEMIFKKQRFIEEHSELLQSNTKIRNDAPPSMENLNLMLSEEEARNNGKPMNTMERKTRRRSIQLLQRLHVSEKKKPEGSVIVDLEETKILTDRGSRRTPAPKAGRGSQTDLSARVPQDELPPVTPNARKQKHRSWDPQQALMLSKSNKKGIPIFSLKAEDTKDNTKPSPLTGSTINKQRGSVVINVPPVAGHSKSSSVGEGNMIKRKSQSPKGDAASLWRHSIVPSSARACAADPGAESPSIGTKPKGSSMSTIMGPTSVLRSASPRSPRSPHTVASPIKRGGSVMIAIPTLSLRKEDTKDGTSVQSRGSIILEKSVVSKSLSKQQQSDSEDDYSDDSDRDDKTESSASSSESERDEDQIGSDEKSDKGDKSEPLSGADHSDTDDDKHNDNDSDSDDDNGKQDTSSDEDDGSYDSSDDDERPPAPKIPFIPTLSLKAQDTKGGTRIVPPINNNTQQQTIPSPRSPPKGLASTSVVDTKLQTLVKPQRAGFRLSIPALALKPEDTKGGGLGNRGSKIMQASQIAKAAEEMEKANTTVVPNISLGSTLKVGGNVSKSQIVPPRTASPRSGTVIESPKRPPSARNEIQQGTGVRASRSPAQGRLQSLLRGTTIGAPVSNNPPSLTSLQNESGSSSGQMIPKLVFGADVLSRKINKENEVQEFCEEESGGGLSVLEHSILNRDPELRLVKQKNAYRVLQGAQVNGVDDPSLLSPDDLLERNQLYLEERNERKIYLSKQLHATILQLIFSLLLSSLGILEPKYTDQFPSNNKKLNIPYLLHIHINHPANSSLIPDLCEKTRQMRPSAFRLFKLLSTHLLQPEQYSKMTRLAVGAYGSVYKCQLEHDKTDVAIKLMELPKSIHDRCVLHDIFTEIFILDSLRHDDRICHTYDFGVSEEYYWIMMKCYRCSLKDWRLRQTRPLSANLRLYCNIFMMILNVMKVCTNNTFMINHFDLKLDNVLISPLSDRVNDSEWINQPTDIPNFKVSLADFGESIVYVKEEDGYTMRSCGTEFNKSPEMLNAVYANKKDQKTYDRRKKTGCGRASDVWAIGCMFYELLTGEFLFKDSDWVKFFVRVTYPNQELISQQRRELIDNNEHLLKFFKWLFIHNPSLRPTLDDVISKFQLLMAHPGMQGSTPAVTGSSKSPDTADSETTAKSLEMEETEHMLRMQGSSADMVFNGEEGPNQLNRTNVVISETDLFSNIISEVVPHLFIGNETKDKNMLKFKYGITHIILCSEKTPCNPTSFQYLHIPNTKHTYKPVMKFFKGVEKQKGNVLIHSTGRQSEVSPLAIIMVYLMATKSWSFYEACTHMKNIRYTFQFNSALWEAVKHIKDKPTSGRLSMKPVPPIPTAATTPPSASPDVSKKKKHRKTPSESLVPPASARSATEPEREVSMHGVPGSLIHFGNNKMSIGGSMRLKRRSGGGVGGLFGGGAAGSIVAHQQQSSEALAPPATPTSAPSINTALQRHMLSRSGEASIQALQEQRQLYLDQQRQSRAHTTSSITSFSAEIILPPNDPIERDRLATISTTNVPVVLPSPSRRSGGPARLHMSSSKLIELQHTESNNNGSSKSNKEKRAKKERKKEAQPVAIPSKESKPRVSSSREPLGPVPSSNQAKRSGGSLRGLPKGWSKINRAED
eukprot:TRINITY_DN4056_c1_g1_i1.p1 TRINITY_DN4056_c1_g1~~TRINITY_DN4056_c1_g1_i1.p1  ORF type:complete len:3194 (-),score=531.19 TRINITY_DN4056_c1_g1_i1:7-9588(-)